MFTFTGCELSHFACENGTCIHASLVCDKQCDCDNCLDETECYYSLFPPPTTVEPTTEATTITPRTASVCRKNYISSNCLLAIQTYKLPYKATAANDI